MKLTKVPKRKPKRLKLSKNASPKPSASGMLVCAVICGLFQRFKILIEHAGETVDIMTVLDDKDIQDRIVLNGADIGYTVILECVPTGLVGKPDTAKDKDSLRMRTAEMPAIYFSARTFARAAADTPAVFEHIVPIINTNKRRPIIVGTQCR